MVKLVPILLLIGGFFAIVHSTAIEAMNDNRRTSVLRYKNKVFSIEYDMQLNWYGAQHFCKARNMELASVESLDEHTALVSHIKEIGRVTWYWLAGNNLETNDKATYYWANTGQKMDFTMWEKGQPDNNHGLENCAHMFWDRSTGTWNDMSCTKIMEFICEMRI